MSGADRRYAYIITVRFRPEMADVVARKYREQTMPLVANAPGLLALLALTQRRTGRGMTIRVWDTAANRALTDLPNEAIIADFADYNELLTDAYTRDPYDVTVLTLQPSSRAQPDVRAAPSVARVTTAELHRERWDEGTAALREFALQNHADDAARSGAILCQNHALGRVMLIVVAETVRDLAGTEADSREFDLTARSSGYARSRIESSVYEVVARI